MNRPRRLGVFALIVIASSLFAVGARATHCPSGEDHPKAVPDNYPCSTPPPPTPKPATPAPAPATAAPRPAPTRAPISRPVGPTTTTAPDSSATPEASPFEVEVPDEDAFATPVIEVDGPIDDDTVNFEVQAEDTASGGSLLVGFVVGFIVGGLIGRASWGLRRKRRQQIFG